MQGIKGLFKFDQENFFWVGKHFFGEENFFVIFLFFAQENNFLVGKIIFGEEKKKGKNQIKKNK